MTRQAYQNDALRKSGMRKPLRARGRQRVGRLLDATEALLEEETEAEISLARIAERAEVPLPSIYHFFPNRNALFVALAVRFQDALRQMAETPLAPPPARWQEIVDRRQRDGAAFLNARPAALRLFLGAGVSVVVRNLDFQGNTSLATIRAAEFRQWFDCAALPDLEQRIAVSIGLTDGIWAASWSAHRRITQHSLSESICAATAYLRCYLPENLPDTIVE